mmetsp:Transcript_23342/g.45927  ORF Transcript_23342/g.45927 Transcript_23342/m.45927 type:complete len:96 (+) Transcript_23342:665-952(+)
MIQKWNTKKAIGMKERAKQKAKKVVGMKERATQKAKKAIGWKTKKVMRNGLEERRSRTVKVQSPKKGYVILKVFWNPLRKTRQMNLKKERTNWVT